MLTVKQLIEHLQKLDQNAIVSLKGYEGGYTDEVGEPYETELYLNVNDAWYYGEHEDDMGYLPNKHHYNKGKRVIIS